MAPRSRAFGVPRSLAILTAILLAACTVGGWNPADLQTGRGGEVTLTAGSGQEVEGELLLADEEGIMILVGGRLTLVPWEAVDALGFDDRPVDNVSDGAVPLPNHLEQVQLASRYPFGLSEDQLDTLLASLGQDAPDELR